MFVKKVIPRSIKEKLKHAQRDRTMSAAVRRFRQLRDGELPSPEMLSHLERGWDEDGFRASGGYLEEVAKRALETNGPILEVGSGLTTILLGLLSERRHTEVWTLEHLPRFHGITRSKLQRHHIPDQHFILAPLTDYGEFVWYQAPLNKMPKDFRLVIADAPPGDTRGGRYGLMPVMREHLAHDALILLDDAHRPDEQAVLRRWASEYNLFHELRSREQKSWAVCKFD